MSHQMAMERRMNLENMRRREMDIEEEQDGGTDGGTENYSDANMSDASIERGSKMSAGNTCSNVLSCTVLPCLCQFDVVLFMHCTASMI